MNISLTLLLLSSIIFGSTLISASVYSLVLSGDGGQGWSGRYGVYGTALIEVGTIPIILSILLGVAGVFFLVMSTRNE